MLRSSPRPFCSVQKTIKKLSSRSFKKKGTRAWEPSTSPTCRCVSFMQGFLRRAAHEAVRRWPILPILHRLSDRYWLPSSYSFGQRGSGFIWLLMLTIALDQRNVNSQLWQGSACELLVAADVGLPGRPQGSPLLYTRKAEMHGKRTG